MTRRAFFGILLLPLARAKTAATSAAATTAFIGGKVEVFRGPITGGCWSMDVVSAYPTPAWAPSRAWPEAMYWRTA